MFVAASTRCFAETDFWETLPQIVDLQFDRVEFWFDEGGSLKPSVVMADPEGFAARVREETRLTPVAFSLAHDIPDADFAGMCKTAKLLRVTQLIVPSSPLGTPFNSEIDRLRHLNRVASMDGVRVAIKTQAGRLSEDAHTAVELCQAVKGLGISYDPSYFLTAKDPDKHLDLVIPHTQHVQLRDSTPGNVQVQVGLGEMDYARIIAVLARSRYERALSVELLPELIPMNERPLEMRKLRMLLDSLL